MSIKLYHVEWLLLPGNHTNNKKCMFHIYHIVSVPGPLQPFPAPYFAYVMTVKGVQLADSGLSVSAGTGPCKCTDISYLLPLLSYFSNS